MTMLEENSATGGEEASKVDPSKMESLFIAAKSGEQEIPVHILPKEALNQMRAEIATDHVIAESQQTIQNEQSLAQKIIEQQAIKDAEFKEGVVMGFGYAKNLSDLQNIAAHQYLDVYDSEKSSVQLLKRSPDGWFEPNGDDPRSLVIIEELNKRRDELTQSDMRHRGAVEAASARVSKAFDGIKERYEQGKEVRAEHKEQKATEKEYDAFDEEMDALRADRKQQKEVRAEAKIEADRREAEARGKELGAKRKLEEVRMARLEDEVRTSQDRQLLERPALNQIIAERKAEAAAPFTAKIKELNARHTEVRSKAEARGLGSTSLSEIDKKYTLEKTALHQESDAAQRAAEAKAKAEHELFENDSVDQIEKLMDFEKADNPEPHVFKPGSQMNTEDAANIAGSNAEMMGKLSPPLQVDEYKLGDSVMQRMVFLTSDKRTVIVEDWDKSSGKLKRQIILKGDNLTIPDYENEGLGRIKTANRKRSGKSRYILNDEVYNDVGLIKKTEVSGDSGTSYQEGYANYSKNLVRSGLGSLDTTRDYAKHDYKHKKSEGFIALLTKGLIKGKTPKK